MKLPSLFAAILVVAVVDGQSELLRPKQASEDTPWEELRNTLSSPDILNLPTPMDWKEQCLDPMIFENEFPSDPFHLFGYDIGYKPSGVCMIHMSCAYEGCNYPFEDCTIENPDCWKFNGVVSPPFDTTDLHEDIMELPAAVLHPNSASDVVRGIEFANQHDIGVTVKVVGHSFFGSSTAKGTLLIKMSTNYPQYAIEGSLTECEVMSFKEGNCNGDEACIDACTVAIGRGKPAFLRVGGGELFDTAYRAVFFDWNENNANQYHFVGGFCGTVSAAGGWVQSGGLSGASMRLHGIGIDQVLHIEMVLPSGTHVRFGPTKWEKQQGDQGYPKTIEVTGYCNAVPYETDESLWEWTPCEDQSINFQDLWFAVRGGGGGTFGIVTSLYYMLHDQPGKLQTVRAFDPNLLTRLETEPEKTVSLMEEYLRFSFRFLFLPETLGNVTELESRSCNSPGRFSAAPAGLLNCHNSAGTKWIEEWKKYLETDCVTCERYGDDQELMAALDNLFFIENEYPSQGHETVLDDGPYAGRLADDNGVILHWTAGTGLDHVPLYTVENHLDELVSFLVEEALTDTLAGGSVGTFYLMGGAVPSSSDQMDSLAPMRRQAALARKSQQPSSFWATGIGTEGNADLYEKFYELVWRDVDTTTADFPGTFCHNHATNEAIGPLKSDWTKPCPSRFEASEAERSELCVSQAESFWGTVNVARLEDIKKSVDPTNMFVCNAGILAATPFNQSEVLETPDPCVEAAGCFDDLGCSFFDQSTQTWSGDYAPCNPAIATCAAVYPDSPCFLNNNIVSPVVCTEDVFECDDGSFVSRDGMNNCEFEECPSSIVCSADVFECEDGSFVSRDEMNNCEFEECPSPIVCTEDVFECDDGSFVSRDAENDCQFPECPTLVEDDGEDNVEDDVKMPWDDSTEDSITVSSADGGCLSIRKYAVAFLFFVGFFLV